MNARNKEEMTVQKIEQLLSQQQALTDCTASLIETLVLTNRVLALMAVDKLEMTKDRSLVLLRIGFQPVEVAKILGVKIGTVTKARSRAEGRTEH